MTGPGAPLRFLALLLALWVGARGIWLWNDQPVQPGPGVHAAPQSLAIHAAAKPHVIVRPLRLPYLRPSAFTAIPKRKLFASDTGGRFLPISESRSAQTAGRSIPDDVRPHAATPDPLVPTMASFDNGTSRWSGTGWLFVRQRSEAAALATSGQLGGSQAGGRVRWRVNSDDPAIVALTARLSASLEQPHAAEVAFGAELHPLPGKPLWITVERRMALSKAARNAWSAHVAGGIWEPGLPLGTIAEGYGQAGVVGVHKRDLFADGAVRVSKPIAGDNSPRIGLGAWGAAQPSVSRLDIGPQATVPITVEGQHLSLSIDLRLRVAGNAAPGSGLAITLGTDF